MKFTTLASCAALMALALPAMAAHHDDSDHDADTHTPQVGYTPDNLIDTAVVETPKGRLIGEDMGDVHVFRGVPYAKAPVGDLRWKAPQPVDAWDGDRTVIEVQAPCVQPMVADPSEPNGGGVVGVKSEDCLYAQVTVPEGAEKAPVMLWMHGGAGFLGAGHLGSYDGTANAKNGVITVSINYRLGPMGYFAHPALTAEGGPTGSFALMDAVGALEWIQENIASFGGDPDNVTIAGQSAGGVMVINLLSTPSAEGLFDRAIIQSGAFVSPGRSLEDGEALGQKGAMTLGLPADATAEQLRNITAQTYTYNPSLRAGVSGVIDGQFQTISAKEAFEAGEEIDVPVLIGSNAGERGFSSATKVAAMTGDEGAPAFLYNFQMMPDFRKEKWVNGPIHSAELMYTFDSLETSSWGAGKTDESDEAYADLVNSCWTAFMKMDVSSKTISCADGFEWPAYNEADQAVAVFADEITVGDASEIPDGPSG
ncbi:carboxylesterase family protein [Henriciella sp. AS95]|uniref:carboxylesterase/lipase family protein n=1 Tax=Henriciella sp. AS95 TaxID=3135782 RepID=UPI00317E3512